jgi:undecaprenyl-diphosphatase
LIVAFLPLLAGLGAAAAVLRWPSFDPASSAPGRRAARTLEGGFQEETGWRRFIAARTNPAAATGLALSVALAVAMVGGFTVGVLAYLVRSNPDVVQADAGVSRWAASHAAQWSNDVLKVLTQFGGTELVVGLAVMVAIVEYRRRPSRWIVPFLAVVLVGQSVLTNSIKALLDRARPELSPAAHFLGPSFPSGHTATAAAFFAAAALLVGRARGRRAHAVLAGVAVAAAVAVACTRVLLDVHWLTDVVAGLALGWAWFAICSLAFGGRLLILGAPIEAAARVSRTDSVHAGTSHPARAPIGVEEPGVDEVQERSRRA